jgi:hypothetical protein
MDILNASSGISSQSEKNIMVDNFLVGRPDGENDNE